MNNFVKTLASTISHISAFCVFYMTVFDVEVLFAGWDDLVAGYHDNGFYSAVWVTASYRW